MFLPVIKPVFRIVFRILSFLLFALTIASAYGGRVSPEWLTFPAVLTMALPYLAIASMIAIVIWICYGRYITAAIGVAALVAAWEPISTVAPVNFPKKADPGASTFKVLSYNILHGDDQQKGNEAPGNRSFEYVMKSGADIVCLQEVCDFIPSEIHNLNEFKDSLRSIYPYQAGSTINDQKVLSKYPVRMLEYEKFFKDGFNPERYSVYEVDIKGIKLTLFNMHLNSYALTDEERDVMKNIASVKSTKYGLSELRGTIWDKIRRNLKYREALVRQMRDAISRVEGPLIICGDFNDVPESYCYRLLCGEDLRDAYVETGFGPMITYNRHAFWFHLDQIFYRGPLRALDVTKGRLKSSDHYPLLATFEIVK